MLVDKANMFVCRSSYKTIHDLIERLVPECPQCFSKMWYFCVDHCCLSPQPVCFTCSKDHSHSHFLHNLNRVQLLHLDKNYLPRQVDAFKKEHEEIKELVESNKQAYLQVIEEYTIYVKQLDDYLAGLERSLQKSVRSTDVFIKLDNIVEQLVSSQGPVTTSTREQYWGLLKCLKLKQVSYQLLPDRYTVLGLNRIRKQIESIMQKYSSLTFQEIIKSKHMNCVFEYDQINKHFITNVFGNLEDRILRSTDQTIDPQVVKNLSKLIIEQADYLEQSDLPHSIKELDYENFNCSQKTVFPEKVQSIAIRIRHNSYSTFKFNNYFLKRLGRLQILKQPHCINTFLEYQHIRNFRSLVELEIYDQGITQQTRMSLYQLALDNQMRIVRIRPDNTREIELKYFKVRKALTLVQKFNRSQIQYIPLKTRNSLLRYLIRA